MSIIIYSPRVKSKRIKIFIPYEMTEERKLLKTVESRFWHKQQRLWSVLNTIENFEMLKTIFKGKYQILNEEKTPVIPKFTLNKVSILALTEAEQKMILKAYSPHTIRSYKSELARFFKYFEIFNIKSVTKEQIESYVFYLITKYKIGESKQNIAINAINPVGL